MADKSLFRLTINPTFRDFKGRFARATDQLLEDRRDQARDLARRHVEVARDEAPKDTGDFARGIRFKTFRKGLDSLGYTLSDPQPLGKFIRLGTKPHLITPRGSGYPLRFFWKKVGRNVAFYSVNHPGTKPNPYMERATNRMQPDMDKSAARISTRYVSQVAKGRAT